jgi:hypothetical protein
MDESIFNEILCYCELDANSKKDIGLSYHSDLLKAMLKENFGFEEISVYISIFSNSISICVGEKEVIYEAGKELKSMGVFISHIAKDFVFTC